MENKNYLMSESSSNLLSWRRNARDTWTYLSVWQKASVLLVMTTFTISALLDLLVISAVFPILASFGDSEVTQGSIPLSEFFTRVWNVSAFDSTEQLLIILVVLLSVKTVFQVLIRFLAYAIRLRLTLAVSSDLLDVFLRRDFLRHKRESTSLMVREINESQMLIQYQLGPLSALVGESALLTVTLGLFFVVSPGITAFLCICGGLLVFLFNKFFSRLSKKFGSLRLVEDETRVQKLTDAFRGFRDIRKNELESRVHQEISVSTRNAMKALESQGLITELLPLLMEASVTAAICVAVIASQQWGVTTSQLLPVLTFFAIGVIRLIPGFARITNALHFLNSATARNSVLLSLLSEKNTNAENRYLIASGLKDSQVLGTPQKLTVHDVSFRYDQHSRETLCGVSIDVLAGEVVGLVGPSGGGKSTLLEVIAGLIAPQSGTVRVETNIGSFAVRAQIALVSQSTFLFSSSVRENLTFDTSGTKIPDWTVLEVLRLVELDSVVDSIPNGLDCRLGDGGVQLSAGQIQRLGLARALLSKPMFLLLDEATNALEEELERRIIRRIREQFPSVGVLLVTHRSSTLEICDRVVTLKANHD